MRLKNSYSDYTEPEFIDLLKEVYRANTEEPDEVLAPFLNIFLK
ncbi:bacteriocin immunity protein [Pseudomonas faucium]|nr:bacteriocin immunity protein [Pseudomonas faucium]